MLLYSGVSLTTCPASVPVQQIRFLDPDCCYKFTYLMANSADPDRFRSQLIWSYPICKGRVYLGDNIIKCRAMTVNRSLQCMAFSRAVMDKKLQPLLFPVGVGAMDTNV